MLGWLKANCRAELAEDFHDRDGPPTKCRPRWLDSVLRQHAPTTNASPRGCTIAHFVRVYAERGSRRSRQPADQEESCASGTGSGTFTIIGSACCCIAESPGNITAQHHYEATGSAPDNAVSESFNSTLEFELLRTRKRRGTTKPDKSAQGARCAPRFHRAPAAGCALVRGSHRNPHRRGQTAVRGGAGSAFAALCRVRHGHPP